MKALALFSGGLDSILSIKLVQREGIEIRGLHFITPFLSEKRERIKVIAKDTVINLQMVKLGEEYLQIVKSPTFGYGKNLNPCIDCRILMYQKAKSYLEEEDFSFLVSGEVLGERPMSQSREALEIIDKESGVAGLVLRPLSAKLLPQTIPEEEGWVRREKLFSIDGRSRKRQLSLAKELGIKNYLQPAGGCLLTESLFCRRLKDLIKYSGLTLENVELLKIGRHFRLIPSAKFIAGRDEEENIKLARFCRRNDVFFYPESRHGPSGLLRGERDVILNEVKNLNRGKQILRASALRMTCASIIAFYTDEVKEEGKTGVVYLKNGEEKRIVVNPLSEEEIKFLRL